MGRRRDPDAARRAAELFQAFAAAHPADPDAWAWVARALYVAADQAPPTEGAQLWRRAYGLVRSSARAHPDHGALNFWTAACLGQYIRQAGRVAQMRHAREVFVLLRQVRRTAPTYFYEGPARFLAMSLVRAPKVTAPLARLAAPEVTPDMLIEGLHQNVYGPHPFIDNFEALARLGCAFGRPELARDLVTHLDSADLASDPMSAPDNDLNCSRVLRALQSLIDGDKHA